MNVALKISPDGTVQTIDTNDVVRTDGRAISRDLTMLIPRGRNGAVNPYAQKVFDVMTNSFTLPIYGDAILTSYVWMECVGLEDSVVTQVREIVAALEGTEELAQRIAYADALDNDTFNNVPLPHRSPYATKEA